MRTPIFYVIPFREKWGWRVTSSGFALMGCRLAINQFGIDEGTRVVLNAQNEMLLGRAIGDLMDSLDGSTRYRTTHSKEGPRTYLSFAHEAGPFHIQRWTIGDVERKDDGGYRMPDMRARLVCACGWRGKARSIKAAHYMIAEQSQHKCPAISAAKHPQQRATPAA